MRIANGIAVAAGCILAACVANKSRPAQTYVVQAQDTLYSIAWRNNLDYHDLARWNHVGSDYRLRVGQILLLHGSSPPSTAHAQAAQTAPHSPAPAPGVPADVNPRDSPDVAISPEAAAVRWLWPTDAPEAPRAVPGGGILFLGQLGQDVHAAAPGRVVYVGSGIRGYGNLIIIDHSKLLLTSYAHNRDVLVHEGQEVSAGQLIAHMGTGPHQVSALYFEIRVNGKPVDPLRYLSAR